MSPNRAAFLTMISHGEGTDRAPDPYAVCYGFTHTIQSFADHPAITGEWTGGRITRGAYAGQPSTAAGRYQINKPTWQLLRTRVSLPNFSPAYQDIGALSLITLHGALPAVDAGDVRSAIALLHEVWASLPGSTAGQGGQSLEVLVDAYTGAGGALA